MKNLWTLAFLLFGLFACQQDPMAAWKETDLLAYGIPVSVMAPDSVQIESGPLGPYQEVTLLSESEGYSIQVLASPANTTDLARLKAQQLAFVKENPYYQKLIREEEAGFIYETAIDSATVSYGFRYIVVQGDQEFVFREGLTGFFEREQVERMYESVK